MANPCIRICTVRILYVIVSNRTENHLCSRDLHSVVEACLLVLRDFNKNKKAFQSKANHPLQKDLWATYLVLGPEIRPKSLCHKVVAIN